MLIVPACREPDQTAATEILFISRLNLQATVVMSTGKVSFRSKTFLKACQPINENEL